MNNFKNQVLKLTLSGLAIFAFGIFVGYNINSGFISSIQGYLFTDVSHSNASNSNASTANASTANASTSNASNSNASTANASSSNASSANARATDNIIYLQMFIFNQTTAKQGDRVPVSITTSGACNTGASIVFKSSDGSSFTAQVQDITGKSYIVIPNNAITTKYSVTDVLLVGKNSDGTTFTKQYSKTGANTFNFNSSLTITAKDGEKPAIIKLVSLVIDKTTASIGEKVNVDALISDRFNSLKLVFTATSGQSFSVNAKDLSSKAYFEIPSSVAVGKYTLTSVVISNDNTSTVYTKDGGNGSEKYPFTETLEITNSTKTTFIYNNEDVNSDVITTLYNAPSGSEITINANSSTLINEELFNSIKGKNKNLVINYKDNQVVFNGSDIEKSKTIDVSMTVSNVSSNEKINELVSEGIIVNFPDNGNLPGKALIKVKANDLVEETLNDNVYAYVYNEGTNNFCEVDTDVKKTSDGYYEFSITHNSDYLLVNKKLDSKLVVAQSNKVTFQKGTRTLLILIIGGVVVIAAAVAVIIVQKRRSSNNNI